MNLHRKVVPNTSCAEFFFCFNNKIIKLNCPSHLRFDMRRKMCYFEDKIICNDTNFNISLLPIDYDNSNFQRIENSKFVDFYPKRL
jgi:hypothetical protein